MIVERVERSAAMAWPALESLELGGWTLRWAGGYSKRANSVQPTGPPSLPLPDALRTAEAWYAERGLPCTFRFTPASDPSVEPFLASAGYGSFDLTSVFYRKLVPGSGFAEAPLDEPPFRDETRSLEEPPLDEWIDAFARMSGMEGGPPPVLRRIVARSGPIRHLGAIRGADTKDPWVACGMAVVDGPLVGLFDIVTHPSWRRKGIGIRLVRGLLAWGASRGAREAYLQVQRANEPARALYHRLGFVHAYDYWYRAPGR